MADFRSTLILSKLQQKVWWGGYNFDGIADPSMQAIQALQIQQLAAHEQQSRMQCQEANRFLNDLKQVDPNSLRQQVTNAVDKSIGAKLVELLNAGLAKSTASTRLYRGWNNVKALSAMETNLRAVDSLLTEVMTGLGMLNPVNFYANFGAETHAIDKIVQALRQAYQLLGSGNFYQYVQMKAAIAEEIAAQVISSHPDYTAVVTGDWMDQKGQQLIEDILVFKDINATFGGEGLTIRMEINGQWETGKVKTVKDLIEIEGRVELSDEAYDAIKKIKAFAVQSKSGIDQNILTKAKRNSISLAQIGGVGSVQGIVGIYNEDMARDDARWFKPSDAQNSKSLNAWANYQLSKNIMNTMLAENEVYFTEFGFMTASQWLEQTKKYIMFAEPVKNLTSDFMSRARALTFTTGG